MILAKTGSVETQTVASLLKRSLQTMIRLLLSWLIAGCGAPPTPSARLLFIGNSYTYENDLPHLFAALAQAGGRPVTVDMVAVGGATLAQHLTTPDASARITAQPWDFVVLQEQSLLPAFAQRRTTEMYPAVRTLVQLVRKAGAQPVLLLTWGRRDGFAEFGFRDYATMQDQLTKGYRTIADELGVAVAPAGEAWRRGVAQDAGLALWQTDGSHPSLLGSYLTACVLYVTVFSVSPVGLPAPRGISEVEARQLQHLAYDTLLEHTERWHVPKTALPQK